MFVPEMKPGANRSEILKYAECDVVSYTQTDGRSFTLTKSWKR